MKHETSHSLEVLREKKNHSHACQGQFIDGCLPEWVNLLESFRSLNFQDSRLL